MCSDFGDEDGPGSHRAEELSEQEFFSYSPLLALRIGPLGWPIYHLHNYKLCMFQYCVWKYCFI